MRHKQNKIMKTEFEIFGYHLDFYCANKYMGSIECEKPEDDIYGYHSRKNYICDKNIKLGKKTIKKGAEYYTEVIPLCGRFKGTQEEKIQAMIKSRIHYGI